jgi:hypothetical protein
MRNNIRAVGLLMACVQPVSLSSVAAQSIGCVLRDERPTLIGDQTGVVFGQIRGVAFVSDTIMAVGDAREANVRFFSMDGRSLASYGRRGSGPREYRQMQGITSHGDMVAVNDPGLRRISTVTLRDGFTGSTEPLGSGTLLKLLSSGAQVFASGTGTRRGQAGPEVWQDTHELRVYETDGTNRLIARAPGRTVVIDVSRGMSILPAPYLPPSSYAISSREVVIGTGTDRVSRFSLAGGGARSMEIPFSGVPVTRSMMEQWVKHEIAKTHPDNEAAYRSLYRVAERPDRTPAHGAIRVDDAGVVWIQEYRAPFDTAPARVAALSATGQILADKVMPGRMTLTAASRSAIAFISTDEFDAESVAIYRIGCT